MTPMQVLATVCLLVGCQARYSDDSVLMGDPYEWLLNRGYQDYSNPMAADDGGDMAGYEYGLNNNNNDEEGYWPREVDDSSEEEPSTFMDRQDFVSRSDDSLEDAARDYIESEAQLRSNTLRDPEQQQMSSLWGTHYVSGGAGEGKQHLKPNGEEDNKQEVKSDSLPAYCEPPNPCPKGYTDDKNCRKDIEDTADFNRKYILAQQSSGYCACDSEHMKHCPSNKPKINSKDDTDADLQAILGDGFADNPFAKGNKRGTLVAKKRPSAKRSKRFIAEDMLEDNPYLSGQKKKVVAKKTPPGAQMEERWEHFQG